jgi:hypothetical protein
MTDRRTIFSRAAAIVLGLAFGSAALSEPGPAGRYRHHGIDLAGIDRSVAPGDDFFAYATGIG